MKNTQSQKGFTLIELLVVVAIIGILASVALASLSGARNRARMASAQSTISAIRAEAETLRGADGTLPNAICTSSTVSALMAKAVTAAGGTYTTTTTQNGTGTGAGNTIVCTTNAASGPTNVAVIMDLNSDTAATSYFCVDDSGNAKSTSTAIATTACN